MDELIKINYDSDRPTILGRDLHDLLEVKTAYKDWFPRIVEYGFTEGIDFCSFLSESNGGSYSPTTLDNAIKMGLTPCKKCVG